MVLMDSSVKLSRILQFITASFLSCHTRMYSYALVAIW